MTWKKSNSSSGVSVSGAYQKIPRWVATTCRISTIFSQKASWVRSSSGCHAEKLGTWSIMAATARDARRREIHGRAWTKSGNLSGTVTRTLYRGDKHIGATYDSRHDAELKQEVFSTVYKQRVQTGRGKNLPSVKCKGFWLRERKALHVQHVHVEIVQ